MPVGLARSSVPHHGTGQHVRRFCFTAGSQPNSKSERKVAYAARQLRSSRADTPSSAISPPRPNRRGTGSIRFQGTGTDGRGVFRRHVRRHFAARTSDSTDPANNADCDAEQVGRPWKVSDAKSPYWRCGRNSYAFIWVRSRLATPKRVACVRSLARCKPRSVR